MSKKGSNSQVNIIIPVFRNLEVTRRCLKSVLASELPVTVSITVIDDASPEYDLSAYCRDLAKEGKITLLVNEKNQGFVAVANRGFNADPDADVLLLNSDTEVAGDWLQRLQSCAYRDKNIGTVTPFTNNGTICSYPNFPCASPMPAKWSTAELDQLFRAGNAHCSEQIPTAVGFCMYIKRQCLVDVGCFDEESFGLGYGEECDFSMRATKNGWKNVIAADVFVFHEGAVSFAECSGERMKKADLVMQSMHPEYNKRVVQFIQKDPLFHYRCNIDSLRLAQKPEDAEAIMIELGQSLAALKERVAELHGILLEERKVREAQHDLFKKSLEKSVWLEKEAEKHITLCGIQQKEIINLADQLRHIRAENETLDELLLRTREDFSKTDNALRQAQKGLAESINLHTQMSEKLSKIEQSRSWRYTAWMRRIAGSL